MLHLAINFGNIDKDEALDIQWEVAEHLYADFSESKYNDARHSEYDCIVNFLKAVNPLKLKVMKPSSNSIDVLVKKHLKSNDDALKSASHLAWVKELIAEISKHFNVGEFKISNGSKDSEYGYNVYAHSSRNRGSLYFRVNPSGVEFMNDKVIHLECDEVLVKKVVEHCNQYFVLAN
jgi:hypothetical protein